MAPLLFAAAVLLSPLVAANQPPSLSRLDGLHVSLAQGGTVRLNLSDYLVDRDDDFSNFSFTVAWDNGTVVSADIARGVLEIRSLTSVAAHAEVLVTATDSAGNVALATVEVDALGAPLSAATLALLLVALLAGLAVGGLLLRSYRKGRQREDGEADAAVTPRLTFILAPPHEGPAAAYLFFMLERGDRSVVVGTASPPSPAAKAKAKRLASVLMEAAMRTREGETVRGETIEYEGTRIIFEGVSPLFLGAVVEPWHDEESMREVLRKIIRMVEDYKAMKARGDEPDNVVARVAESLDEVFQP